MFSLKIMDFLLGAVIAFASLQLFSMTMPPKAGFSMNLIPVEIMPIHLAPQEADKSAAVTANRLPDMPKPKQLPPPAPKARLKVNIPLPGIKSAQEDVPERESSKYSLNHSWQPNTPETFMEKAPFEAETMEINASKGKGGFFNIGRLKNLFRRKN